MIFHINTSEDFVKLDSYEVFVDCGGWLVIQL